MSRFAKRLVLGIAIVAVVVVVAVLVWGRAGNKVVHLPMAWFSKAAEGM